jgi:hypothetical protein
MKGMLRPTDVRTAVAGELPVRKLFSKEQRAFYAAHAPEGLALDDLTILGPIFVLKLRLTPKKLNNRRLVAEIWGYPDGSRVLELSTRCGTTEAQAAELRPFLGEGWRSPASRRRRRARRFSTSQRPSERPARDSGTPDCAPLGVADVRRPVR